jgi:hypothetical protein
MAPKERTLTINRGGWQMTYRPYSWKKFVEARNRARVHKLLNYRIIKKAS